MRRIAATIIAGTIFLSGSAAAQTQAQQDRLNRFGQLAVTSAVCAHLGMQVDEDIGTKAEAALEAETSDWHVDSTTIKALTNEAAHRQGAILRTDLGGAAEAAKTETQLRGLNDILLTYGRTCVAATSDPIFAKLIIAPPGYDVETAVRAYADRLLEAGGLASWQTPKIQAQGDLMTLAGGCRKKIGAMRSDALAKEFGQSSQPRVRNYYSASFDRGLEDPTFDWTLSECNRAITRLRAKVAGSK